jgi:ABC-2 type transport system ATP-binding protein
MPTIRASGLTKYFGGKRALGPVSFEIAAGETVGFLGLNGAGKTTLLRILAGDLRPSAGVLEVGEVDALREPLAVRRLVGFLPERPPLYPDMRVGDYLRFAARIRGTSKEGAEAGLREVSGLLGLGAVEGDVVRNLSQGYRQRVGLAQALIHEPPLLILDEPAHDLDPAQIVEMRGLIRALKDRHTILLSSHNLPEISETCDRILVLDAGEVVASGTEAELSARLIDRHRFEVEVRPPTEPGAAAATAPESEPGAAGLLRELDGVRQVTPGERDGDALVLLVESVDDRRAEVCRALVEAGFDVVRLERSRRKLESIFLDLVGGAEHGERRSHPAA